MPFIIIAAFKIGDVIGVEHHGTNAQSARDLRALPDAMVRYRADHGIGAVHGHVQKSTVQYVITAITVKRAVQRNQALDLLLVIQYAGRVKIVIFKACIPVLCQRCGLLGLCGIWNDIKSFQCSFSAFLYSWVKPFN